MWFFAAVTPAEASIVAAVLSFVLGIATLIVKALRRPNGLAASNEAELLRSTANLALHLGQVNRDLEAAVASEQRRRRRCERRLNALERQGP